MTGKERILCAFQHKEGDGVLINVWNDYGKYKNLT